MVAFRGAVARMVIYVVVMSLLFAGCRVPSPRVERETFLEKPLLAPTPIRTYGEISSWYDNRQDDPEKHWVLLSSSDPAFLRDAAVEEPPILATPWYEYLRCGGDFTSKVDMAIYDEYKKACKKASINDTSAALRRLIAGTLAFELGFLNESRRHFLEAVWWMEEATDKNLESQSAVGRADVKIYKGNSYERAMAHFYLGLIAYQIKDFHEARREFSRAIQADQTKPAENMRGKFALLHYWIGKTYIRLGDIDNARIAMEKARESGLDSEESIFNMETIQGSNLTLLVQIGCGPVRILKGSDWEHSEYKPAEFLERGCDVFIDGKLSGKCHLLADAWQQVSSSGVSEQQRLQGAKGSAKTVLQVMPYVGLLAVAWDVRGDIRSWSVLPGQILIWNGTVPPGEHTVTLKFYGSNDYELIKYRQIWYFIPTSEVDETVVILRSARNKCNMYGKGS